MSGDELFVGFTPEQEAAYEEEAAERWGDGVHESNRLWRSYSDEKKRAVLQEGQAIYRDLIAAMRRRGVALPWTGFFRPEVIAPELLRDMREAAPREPAYVPYTPWVSQPSTTGEPYRYWDTVTIC